MKADTQTDKSDLRNKEGKGLGIKMWLKEKVVCSGGGGYYKDKFSCELGQDFLPFYSSNLNFFTIQFQSSIQLNLDQTIFA